MGNWRKLAIGCILAIGLLLTGCNLQANPSSTGTGGHLKVVTTFYPLYEFSKQIAGNDADVAMLIPSGMEPHDWEPTPKDVARISEAGVFVYNGGGIEPWVDNVLKSVDEPNLHVVEATNGIHLMEGTAEGGEEEQYKASRKALDPHVWLDPALAQTEVQTIADAFVAADPQHADVYRKNAAAYIGKLKELDNTYKTTLQTTKAKEFVTQHAAFGYLARQYGLTQLPIAGLDPEQEPSAAEMADIISFAKAHQVKTIFFETLVSPKVAQSVAQEIGASTAVLNPLEGLTDEEKAQGLDYIAVMKNNLDALTKALNQ
ncbi:MAG: metal ABC transporter substrate-binding protein [Tumebacillaceae bacterium]